jgi:hypothetical protein
MGQKFAEQFISFDIQFPDVGLNQSLGKGFADLPIFFNQNLFGLRVYQVL